VWCENDWIPMDIQFQTHEHIIKEMKVIRMDYNRDF
jgi:hypothetical protein